TDLIKQVRNMGLFYSEGFGMSETTSVATGNPILGLKKAGSIGIPMPDNDIRIVDLETAEKDVPQGEPGELLVKGPTIMKEYWNAPEKTAEDLKDGWLHTGDICTQDEDGYLFIVDRKKDMVIAGGYNIYPRDIDEVLYQHPKILDAVSVGVPHEYRGETVKAYVVLKEGVTATAEEIIAFCKEKLAVYKVPKIVEFRAELPKSAVGKILRKVLRDEEVSKMEEK
ncbi:MAG: long-chain fatty acid--CoA ligase, partial [Proteobacteria bacterium]|nr:long-chain fatty acid--CoA ligase [Pseudomonadota bacterium]